MENEIQEFDYSDALNMLTDLINNKEINLKRSLKRKIVFWYDADQEFYKCIKNFKKDFDSEATELIEYAKNSFWIRYYIEIENPTKNFVIYFPYAKKDSHENDLMDLESSSGYELSFNPDQTTKIIVELGLNDDNKYLVQENKKFFGNQVRRDKFKEFDCPKNNSTINYIVTSVCLGIKSINEDDILKSIFKSYYLEKNKFKQLQSFGNSNFIFDLINKSFGVKIDSYDLLDELISNMIITYFVEDIKDKNKFNKYGDCIVNKKSNAQIFINNMMNDLTLRDLYKKLANKVYIEYGLNKEFDHIEINECLSNDAFSDIDKKIISYIIEQLVNNSINYDELKNVINNRKNTFWYSDFSNEYTVLLNAIEYLKYEKINIPKIKTMSIEDLSELYTKKLFSLDSYYRKILYYYDQIKYKDEFQDLLALIENHYSNNYMFELSSKWDEALLRLTDYSSTGLTLQNKFFDKYIVPELNNSKSGRLFIIVSDAFRYEIAKELNDKLVTIDKNTTIDKMLGMVPSYTKLGKAVLLPNKEVSYIENSDDVLIDGQRSSSTSDREKLLQSVEIDSIAIQFDEIDRYKTSDLKDLVKGKKIIYIYHDVVDNFGETNSDEVFNASEKAINEIYNFIEKIHKTFSGVNVYITADHGFFYKRGEIKASDKINHVDNVDKKKTRYIISKDKQTNESVISFNLGYIFNNYNGYVSIPRGHNVFSKQGVNDKYYHGGGMPHELLIPVIDFKSSRGAKEPNKVGIVYSGLTNKITNTITYLNFTQNTNVDEDNIECSYVVYFEDDQHNKISNEIKIIANKTESDYNDRVFKEKFYFKSINYNLENNYYLVIREEGKNVDYSRTKFDIDIAFSNNFDF